jgi:GTPase SAR1 family protein
MKTPELNEVAALAANYVNTTDRHIFLTGNAGTGKTTFLRYIVEHTYKNTVVAAPTGIAAINAGGVTLHSLLQLPFGTFVPENIPLGEGSLQINTPRTLGQKLRFRGRKQALLRELELLIIDEVSMLRADLLDCIDLTLRAVRRRRYEPFGGLQILFIGDLMQLPPVVKDSEWPILQQYYNSTYFFEAHALRETPPLSVELQKIYRQSDQDFIDLLNRLRHNEQTEADLTRLNQYYQPDADTADSQGYIHLTTHNRKADRINLHRLEQLAGKVQSYAASTEGEFPEHLYPTHHALDLKVGAQVMFLKNDPNGEGRFFNGKIGQVSRMAKDELWVRFEDGEEIEVERHEWENKRFSLNEGNHEVEEKTLGRFTQYPLKLAWAVTIHKSQGLTFERAILDVADSFAPGQLYVALSRLTSLAGLRLSSPLPKHPPQIDASLRAFVKEFPDQERLLNDLQQDRRGFLQKFAARAFGFTPLLTALREHAQTFDKDDRRSLKQKHLPWTQELIAETTPLQETGARFLRQVKRLLQQPDGLTQLAERTQKAHAYFEPILHQLITRIQAQRHKLSGQGQVKAYREELDILAASFEEQHRLIMKLCLLVQETAAGRVPSKDQLRQWEQRHRPPQVAKPSKTPTAAITFALFQAGKNPEEIAAERGLTEGTILSHLTKYVASGQIDVSRFVSDEHLALILAAKQASPTPNLGDIKAQLPDPDAINYDAIRFAVAHAQWQETQAQA